MDIEKPPATLDPNDKDIRKRAIEVLGTVDVATNTTENYLDLLHRRLAELKDQLLAFKGLEDELNSKKREGLEQQIKKANTDLEYVLHGKETRETDVAA